MGELLTPEAIKEIISEHYPCFDPEEEGHIIELEEAIAKAQLAKIQGKDSGIQRMYKEGITPLLTDTSEVTGILPSQGTGKKLEEVCPECKRHIGKYTGNYHCSNCGQMFPIAKQAEFLAHQASCDFICPTCQGKAKKLRPELKKGIYDIVLAARTEGIIGGKTKRFARYDTSEILSLMEGK